MKTPGALPGLFLLLLCESGIVVVQCGTCPPAEVEVTAPPGRNCAVVKWSGDCRDKYDNVDLWYGDCWPATYRTLSCTRGWWLTEFSCEWTVSVRVIHCYGMPSSFSNGHRSCTGDEYNLYGARCSHSCNAGYKLIVPSTVTCQRNGDWSGPIPHCYEMCSWQNSHCWPGDCADELSRNCLCRSGFTPTNGPGSSKRCGLATPPNLNTCRVSVASDRGVVKDSGYVGSIKNCSNQRDEFIRFQPAALSFVVKANLDLAIDPSRPTPHHISRSAVGVVNAHIALVKVGLSGAPIQVRRVPLNDANYCQDRISSTSPRIKGTLHDCEGNITVPTRLSDGERLCADIEASSGGFYHLQDESGGSRGTVTYQPVPKSKRICFTYDATKSIHCSQTRHSCSSDDMLRLSTRLTRSPKVGVRISGWEDPVPHGGSYTSASGIDKYRLEVHGVDAQGTSVSVQDAARKNYAIELQANRAHPAGPYDVVVTLPEENATRLFAIILEVHDKAGNVAYARRLVLYDHTSAVELLDTASLRIISANTRTNLRWQTDVSRNVCVDWKERFYNSELYNNNFLQPVRPDIGREIDGQYDQLAGTLPVNGTSNVNGIVKFEILWSIDGGPTTTYAVPDVHNQTGCLPRPWSDGQTYDVRVRATDIMDNYREDSVRVSIDHTGPVVNIVGLRGRFGRDGLYVHNTTDLSAMLLLLQAEDPHSGLMSLQWTLGTQHLAHDVGMGNVGAQRLENATDCHGRDDCYCPAVGECEIHNYLINFNRLVNNNSEKGQHHRQYYITVTATNHATLHTRQTLEILVDDSPPSAGVVLEGLADDDKAEMDFTSSRNVHVRWHGFLDHESGVLMYRVALAPRCLSGTEIDTNANATEISGQGEMTSFDFPSEGKYFTTVVAYNGAMEPSTVSCSDGITYDTTPPRLLNVTLTHARSGQSVECAQSGQAWLVNSNMTRVRLASTQHCLALCARHFPTAAADPNYLPLSSNNTLDSQASDHLCRTLAVRREDWPIMLPSDYVRLAWQATDAESDMEEYYMGLGTDRTKASAPDLLPFTPTHGHTLYHARHSGLGQGDLFYIFLRAVSKAGLYAEVTLGPVIIDVTPPDVTQTLTTKVVGNHLVTMWNYSTFVDLEQPAGIDMDVTFRVGYDNTFITPLLSNPRSAVPECLRENATGCARYPVSALYAYDTEAGRLFYFQIQVSNAAGHVVTVNTSSVQLPTHMAPNHAVVIDAIKSESPGSNVNDTSSQTLEFLHDTEDVDAIAQQEEICIAWHGLYHEDEVSIEVGIGTLPSTDDLIFFETVENKSPACINASSLPVYDKLYSVVRATSPGGSTIFSSDGFRMIPLDDPANRLQVFTGRGCAATDIIGSQVVTPGLDTVDLTAMCSVPLHPGDPVFVGLTPFIQHVQFPDTMVLQTTLTGYQLVSGSSHLTAELPAPITTNTTVQVFTCLKDTTILPMPQSHMTVNWEITGPLEAFVKRWKIEVMDESCLKTSPKKDKYRHQSCLLDETSALSPEREAYIGAQSIIPGHEYVVSVAVCFDGSCLPAAKSSPVIFSLNPPSVSFTNTAISSQDADKVEVKMAAGVDRFHDTSLLRPCVFMWSVARDPFGALPITDWSVEQSATCADMTVHRSINYTGVDHGTLYACLQAVFPWRLDSPTCHSLARQESVAHPGPWHVIELPHSVYRQKDLQQYLHSRQLGEQLFELFDLDLDFARSDVLLSALVTFSEGRDVTWFLMTSPHVPVDGDCAGDAKCVTSITDKKGSVVFPRARSSLQDGHMYFVCARLSPRQPHPMTSDPDPLISDPLHATPADVCGDGVVIDDAPPVGGSVTIGNARSGYLSDSSLVTVSWAGFSDVEKKAASPLDVVTLNYSVALGSYLGGEDLSAFVSVGQRTSWTFRHLSIGTGATCIATIRAEDRVGHVTEVWSQAAIMDNTPPTVGRVAAGTITQEHFVAGPELPVRLEGVEDKESGIKLIEVAVSTEGGQDDVIPFVACHGDTAILSDTSALVDGHSYVILAKVTNGAGLTTLAASEPFIMDSSPPGPGQVWNSAQHNNFQNDHGSYSTSVGTYSVHWSGFRDPHSGLHFYRLGLGSRPLNTDIHPFLYIGQQTSYIWRRDFEQGKPYYVTVEACNRAGLCRVASSIGMTFDDSPPTQGQVTVGLQGHHSKYLGHNDSLPVQWIGFSDPQTGIQDFRWCVGTASGNCDVMASEMTSLSRGTVRSGLTLPVGIPLYVTVRARNPAGLETVSVSDSFIVDPSPPELVIRPHFLTPRDGSPANSQWDRSVLRLAWLFEDPDSTVVSHTVSIPSNLTGRLVVDPITTGADTEMTLSLDMEHLLADGDTYYAAVTACNAAGLCTTSMSDLYLIDSTPPVVGTLRSPLTWRKLSTPGHSTGTSRAGNTSATDYNVNLDVIWERFADAESEIAAYYVMAGRAYNGEELSGGPVRVDHDVTDTVQRHTLTLSDVISPGEVIYLAVWAENTLGRHSPMMRMAFDVLQDNDNGTSGTLVAVRHSCDVAFCTKDCTCAPKGQCEETTHAAPCEQYDTDHPALSTFRLSAYMGSPSGPQTVTTSAKCLEGHWQLSDPRSMTIVSRFQWSFSLANATEGEGIFNTSDEIVWYDVGRNTSAIHCLPGTRELLSGQSYVLHVRTWLSAQHHVTILSPPVMVDHTPPQVRARHHVLDSDISCRGDLDYITDEPTITACWDGVFQDKQSQVTMYAVWLGTSPQSDDHIQKILVGLNTSWTFSTASLEQGTRYYVTVQAVNGAGLLATDVSDGITIDVVPPVTGVVFATHRYSHVPAQASTSSLSASWQGFQDMHSGLASYQIAVYDVTDNAVAVTPFTNAGLRTKYTYKGFQLEHGHRYKVVVKAKDRAGLESKPVESRAILIDVSPPEGVTCNSYQLQEERTLSYMSTSSFMYTSYATEFSLNLPNFDELLKLELLGSNIAAGAGGYVSVEERKMLIHFQYAQSGQATAQHVFMASGDEENTTISVEVQGKPGSQITARLFRCNHTTVSDSQSVTVQQLSQFSLSVCARVRDTESGLRSLLVGVGTTPGGLQVRPLSPVGHSGHSSLDVELQHGLLVYATVHAENHAGQWSRFISQPVTMDRTPPEISGVTVSLQYEEDRGQVWAKATWETEDAESGVVSCTCRLEGQSSIEQAIHKTTAMASGLCQWQLRHPQHGASLQVTVSCVNGVQIHATETSDPVMVLLQPPNLQQATVESLSNHALVSPFHASDLGVRSSNTSLEVCWHGFSDATISQLHFRFLHESLPLTEWSPVDVYKTSALLERGTDKLPTGDVVAQVRALNARNMTSDPVITSIHVDDRKPSLTGKSASASLTNSVLDLTWQGVFSTSSDVIFAVYGGTAKGFGDVVNHVITTATSYRGYYADTLPNLFITIQATQANGMSEVYETEVRL